MSGDEYEQTFYDECHNAATYGEWGLEYIPPAIFKGEDRDRIVETYVWHYYNGYMKGSSYGRK